MALECSKEQGPGWRGCWLEGYQDASLPLSLPLPSPSSKKYFFLKNEAVCSHEGSLPG